MKKYTLKRKTGSPNVGTIVTWKIGRFLIRRDTLQEACDDNGITVKVPEVRPGTFLCRAVRDAVKDGWIRKLGEDANFVTYAVVEEETNFQNRSWEGELKEAITLDKRTGDVSFRFESELSRAIGDVLRTNSGGLVTNDVSRWLATVMTRDAHGITLRDLGGVYFVPNTHTFVLDAVDNAMRTARPRGGVFRLNRYEMVHTQRGIVDLATTFSDLISKSADDIVAEIRNMHDDPDRPTMTTDRALRTRLKRVAELTRRVQEYETLLNVKMKGAARTIQSARTVVKDKLDSIIADEFK